MTEAEERREIARNAKTALREGKITQAQYNDVRVMLIVTKLEQQILGKYPEAKGQTK